MDFLQILINFIIGFVSSIVATIVINNWGKIYKHHLTAISKTIFILIAVFIAWSLKNYIEKGQPDIYSAPVIAVYWLGAIIGVYAFRKDIVDRFKKK